MSFVPNFFIGSNLPHLASPAMQDASGAKTRTPAMQHPDGWKTSTPPPAAAIAPIVRPPVDGGPVVTRVDG